MSTIPARATEATGSPLPDRDTVLAPVARVGYAARGLAYVLVGGLAVAAAVQAGRDDAPDLKSAARWLLGQPFGVVVVLAIAVGIAAFGTWQIVRGFEDADHDGSDRNALKRAGYVLSGLAQFVIAYGIFRVARGYGAASGEQSTDDRTAELMSYPLGRWAVAVIGVGVVVYAARQFVRAYEADLDDQLDLSRLGATPHRWTVAVSRFGIAARGVVFAITGLFFIVAAWHANATEARGLGGALETLRRQPYGPWLMAAAAAGIIAYGLYLFVLARYRRIGKH